ncbi:ABC transporter permease/M1 family aminopeptidase [Archangium sp.]|uniref:ABC transporter permease/M1 family aminopeptidase n=1 Tax=Archangium sp. TaxID=1872627 RepID=UPI003899896E
MLSELVRFEWRYHTRQVTFAAAALGFFLLGFALMATGFGPANVKLQAPWLIAESMGFLSLLSVFALAIFSANAVVRDDEHRMAEILYCTPVGKLQYLSSRFAGSFLAAVSAFGFSAVGMLAASFMPWQDPERLGAVNALGYLWAFAVLVLPNMLFAAALLFSLAALTRSTLASHIGAVAVYVLYLICAALTDSPLMAASAPGGGEGFAFAALLDPFGLSGFFDQTRYWTVAEQNSRFVALSGTFLANRVATVGAAVLLLAGVYRLFSFRVLRKAKGAERPGTVPHAASTGSAPASVRVPHRAPAPADPGAFGTWLAAYASAVKLELRTLLKSIPFLLVLLLWMALAGAELLSELTGGEYGSRSHPATGLIISALRQPLSLLGTIVLVYYSTELVWRERRFRIADTLAATPASSSAFVASKWTALAALVLGLITTGIFVGLAVQVAHGYSKFEPGLYLSLFYFEGTPLLLFAAAAVFLHALSPGKYVGMLLVLLVGLLKLRGGALGLEHHLWRFASAPAVPYSDMNGFGHLATPFHWFMLHWAVLGLLLAAGASALWRRGLRGQARTYRPAAAGLLAVSALTGGWILYNTDGVNDRMSSRELLDWKADYEKAYKPFAQLPRPTVASVTTDVELYPEERRHRVSGRYQLVNETQTALRKVLVSVNRKARGVELSIPGAKLASRDERFGMYWFELDAPLAPKARTELRFALEFSQPGFTDDEPDTTVVGNGSFVSGPRNFPSLGYRTSYELEDPRERRKRGLPEGTLREDSDLGEETEVPEWVDFEATVSTSADQVAVAPGKLERQWEQDGRRYFHFRSEARMTNVVAFASARYEVSTLRHGDVAIEVYSHPAHRYNVERMLRAAAASLDTMEKHFGPYPHEVLRIAEVPTYWKFGAFAMPSIIFFTEDRGFLTDSTDPERLDLVSRRIAHEVAHQWWGHQLAPAIGAGDSMLVESLTKYSELLVMEELYGREKVRGFLSFELDRYLSGRSHEEVRELPLSRVKGQPYIYYGKGAIVMYALKDLLGEEPVDRALRELLRTEGGPGGAATTRDLLARLYAVAPGELHPLIEGWLEEITLYDLKLESAAVTPLPDGRYEVKMRIAAARSQADGSGNESPVELSESIQVGIFSAHPDQAAGTGQVLYLRPRALHSGINEVSAVVDAQPAVVAVDPYITRVDRNRFDNLRALR